MKVLFVCRGNVGRSQMAKAFFDKFTHTKDKSECAGTKVFEKEGQMVKNLDPSIINAMKEEGIDMSDSVRKQITPQMIKKADKIILMAERENISDDLFNNPRSIFWDIEDPMKAPYNKICHVRDQIKEKVKEFLKQGKK